MGSNLRSFSVFSILFAATGLAAASCESSDSSSNNPPFSVDSGQFTPDSSVTAETGAADTSTVDAADAGTDAAPATSCKGTLPANCGTPATDDCCATLPVPAGTFMRSATGTAWDGTNATLPAFKLDKYEVTVGRFRQFVNAGKGTQGAAPADGSGANPNVPASGWQTAYSAQLPADKNALESLLACDPTATWTNAGGANETVALNCTSWFVAFAFCAWDGGRLPTEAEWAYAAAGGSEQRIYAWTADADAAAADDTFANFGNSRCNTDGGCVAHVGSYPKGVGKWGQLDLTGNVHEWTRDYWHPTPPATCTNDCADLVDNGQYSFRGGSFLDSLPATHAFARYYTFDVAGASVGVSNIGIRCARD